MWQRVLQVQTLVSQLEDDSAMWIKFANLCRKSDRMVLADKTINSLLCAVSNINFLSPIFLPSHMRICSPLLTLNIGKRRTSKHLPMSFMRSSSLCGRMVLKMNLLDIFDLSRVVWTTTYKLKLLQ